jgi:hypothetical protein
MVQKFGEYINESNGGANLTYSVITALAVFKPEFFEFLNSMKNRYFLTDNSFWQGLILEVKQTPEIKLDKQHLLDIKGISIENDWIKLKKCVSAAEKIKMSFPEISSIRVLNTAGMVINGTDLIRNKRDEDKLNAMDINKYLGFDGRSVYSHNYWKYLVKHWVYAMKKHLNEESLNHYNFFLERIEESKQEINWQTFKNFKVKGLGIRIDKLPKLYYNSFYELNLAMSVDESCFNDYKAFVVEWLNFKNDILNKKILYPLINQNNNRLEAAQDMLVKYYSLDAQKYYRFDSKLNILEVPSLDDFKSKSADLNIKEKYLINNRKDLIIMIQSEKIHLKVMIAMQGLCPSTITIKSRYDEIGDGLEKMGEL